MKEINESDLNNKYQSVSVPPSSVLVTINLTLQELKGPFVHGTNLQSKLHSEKDKKK